MANNFYQVPGLIPVAGGGGGGGGQILIPATDINVNWAGPFSGADGSGHPGGSLANSLAFNDSDTNYLAILEGTLGNNPQRCGLNGVVTVGKVWTLMVVVRVFPTAGPLDSGLWTAVLYDNNGDAFSTVALADSINLAGLNSTWTAKTKVIDGTLAPSGNNPALANSIEMGAGGLKTGVGTHILTTYVQVSR